MGLGHEHSSYLLPLPVVREPVAQHEKQQQKIRKAARTFGTDSSTPLLDAIAVQIRRSDDRVQQVELQTVPARKVATTSAK